MSEAPIVPMGSPAATPAQTVTRNALHLVLGQIVSVALGMGVSALLGRTLGAADFGLFYLATTLTTFAYVLVDWGQGPYLVREVANRHASAGRFLGSALLLRFAGAALMTAVAALLTSVLGYDDRKQAVIILMLATYLPLSAGQAVSFIFRSHERMDLDATTNAVAAALSAAMLVPVLLLGGGIFAVVLAEGAGYALTFIVYWALLRRLKIGRVRPDKATLHELLANGATFVSLQLLVSAQPYLDATLLSKLAPAAAVGWYGASARFGGTLLIPATVLGSALYPRLSRLFGTDLPGYSAMVRAGLRPLLAMGAFVAVGTWLFAGLAVGIVFGREKYGPAVVVLQAIAPLIMLCFVNMLFGAALTAARLQRRLVPAKLVAVAVAAGLDALLIPIFQSRYGNGGLGVAIASSGSELTMLVIGLQLLPKGIVDGAAIKQIALATFIAFASVGAAEAAALLVHPYLRIPAGLGTFTLLSLVLGLVSGADLALVREALRSKQQRKPA